MTHQDTVASRHRGIESAFRARATLAASRGSRATRSFRAFRGFSLVELMMAILILGIGIISIAALFPAGIAQQRKASDNVMGPIVAQQAYGVISSLLRAEDFGTFEEFGFGSPDFIEGDWPWLRPAFIFPGDAPDYPLGAIDIFNTTGVATANEYASGIGASLLDPYGIPFNTLKYSASDPIFVITQQERYYPQASAFASTETPPRPQYVWDCMFRRYRGKMLVAIFVYRVSTTSGESGTFSVLPNTSESEIPPLPVAVPLADTTGEWDWTGPDGDPTTLDGNIVLGTDPCSSYDVLASEVDSWQEPGQWILDQRNNVHRVLTAYCDDAADPRVVELVRPIPEPVWFILSLAPPADFDLIQQVWFIPENHQSDFRLTPVFLTVKEL